MAVIDFSSRVDFGQDVFMVASQGLANVYRANCFLTTDRVPAKTRVRQMCSPIPRQLSNKNFFLLRSIMDLRGSIPCFIRITEGKVHDVNILDELVLEPGAFYIMDRGYLDFARLYTFTQSLCSFVTRAKSNFDYRRLYYRKVDKSKGLRCDQTIRLNGFYASQDYPASLRRIGYFDIETNKKSTPFD